jgi:phosphatidate cytidylyltransferase
VQKSKKTRIVIGTLLVMLVFGLLALDRWLETHWGVGSIIALLGLAGAREFAKIAGIAAGGHPTDRALEALTILGAGWFLLEAALAGTGRVAGSEWLVGGLVGVVLLACLIAIVRAEPEHSFPRVLAVLLGVVLFGVLYGYVLRLYVESPVDGAWIRGVGFFLGVKGTDIVAYLVGSSIGRIRFLKISPGKTLEGYLAAVLFGALWFAGLGAVSEEHFFGWSDGILFGILLSGTSFLGDLSESLIKRYYRVKDSSALLPEFGGVLDLIDSFLFSAFVFHCLLRG